MEAAKGDLSGVLANLEGHWNVLEAEVEELNKDIQRVDECLRKYGELFRLPFQHLKQLKREKKERMKDIIGQLETFNANLEAGRKLLKTLDKGNSVVIGSDIIGGRTSAKKRNARKMMTPSRHSTVIHAHSPE